MDRQHLPRAQHDDSSVRVRGRGPGSRGHERAARQPAAANADGCSLLVAPDVLDVAASNGGAVATQLAIPDTLVLVGLHWRQQLILLELDQSLLFLQNTSNNAVALTIGARCVAARAGSVCDGRSRCRRASIR